MAKTFAFGVMIFLLSAPSEGVRGALVTLNEDTIIDGTNSYAEPPLGELPLELRIVDGPAGPTTVTLKDGAVVGGYVDVFDSGHLRLEGGQIQALVVVRDEATLTMSGGSVEPLTRIYSSATATSVLRLEDSAVANISGGLLGLKSIVLLDSSVVNLYGHSFIVDGDLPTGTNPGAAVRVQGFLADNQPIDYTFERAPLTARVFLHAVPEPALLPLSATLALTSIRRLRS